MKTNMEILEKNKILLQSGWDKVEVTTSVNKTQYEECRVMCGYCGATYRRNGAELMRCACRAAYYCCEEHQQSHWNHHKGTCIAIRRKLR